MDLFITDPLVSGLVSAAGRQILYATVVFVLVAPVCALLVRRWPYRAAPLRAALWSLVLLRLVLPPSLSLPWSMGAVLDLSPPKLWEGGEELHAPWGEAVPELAPQVSSSSPTGARRSLILGLLGWGLGAAGVAFLLVRRRRRYGDLVKTGRMLEGGPESARAAHWRRRFRIRRPVRLVTVAAPVSPFTLGVLRPVICLPDALLGEPRLVEAALAHEMAHIARWDDLRLLLQRGIQALWFFHPVAWLAGARLHEERERLCDARVLASGALSPRDYGRSLLTAVQMNLEGVASSPAFGAPKGRIAMRIREIVKEGHRRPRTLPALLTVTLLGLFLLPLAPTSGALDESAADTSTWAPRWSWALSGEWSGSPPGRHPGAATAHGDRHAVGDSEGRPGHPHAARHGGPVWGRPVPQGRLTSPFGQRVHPLSGERVHHRGVDLAAPAGTPIVSPAPGRVAVATERYEGGDHHGTVLVLDHGEGLRSFYSHLDSLSVTPGQEVVRGQQVGTVGSSGEVTGPHLHFEVWQDGEPVDPGSLVPSLRDG